MSEYACAATGVLQVPRTGVPRLTEYEGWTTGVATGGVEPDRKGAATGIGDLVGVNMDWARLREEWTDSYKALAFSRAFSVALI